MAQALFNAPGGFQPKKVHGRESHSTPLKESKHRIRLLKLFVHLSLFISIPYVSRYKDPGKRLTKYLQKTPLSLLMGTLPEVLGPTSKRCS
jgi:hypothetical protein